MAQGNLPGALDVWKKATINNGEISEYWRGLANVLDLMGELEKSKIAKEHADRLDSQLIAEKTGRKMEDILADLLDDGILNFSAGSDSISKENPTSSGLNNEDLTLIPGIGKVSAKRLNMQGISTIEQVSKMQDSDIMEIINSKKLDAWADMAKKLLENNK
jgi:predicted flap endonuclease-1-like 5' DNA nuclease